MPNRYGITLECPYCKKKFNTVIEECQGGLILIHCKAGCGTEFGVRIKVTVDPTYYRIEKDVPQTTQTHTVTIIDSQAIDPNLGRS